MNNASPLTSASVGLKIISHTSGFMEAYSSKTTKERPTPLKVSGLSDPFRYILRSLISVIVAVFSCVLLITSCPISFKMDQRMSLACWKVGAT